LIAARRRLYVSPPRIVHIVPTNPVPARAPRDDAQPTAACLIHGPDDFLVNRSARALIDTACPPAEQTFGLEQVDGRADTLDAAVAALRNCLAAVRTPSFLGARKVVWFRDVTFLKNERLLRNEDLRRWLDEMTALIRDGLPPGHLLVLTAPAVDGRSALCKAFKTAGRVIEHRRPEKERELTAAAVDLARESLERAGVRADLAALNELAGRVGADARTMAQEAEKLAAWAGARKAVSVEDVRRLVPATRETAGWDLADAVGKGQLAEALAVLRQLLRQSESEIGLIAGLESRFRDLTLMRDCRDRGWVRLDGRSAVWSDAPDAADVLGALGERDPRKMHPYRAYLLFEQSGRYSPERLQAIRAEILETRERMVSGFSRADLLLEFLILRICRPGAGGGA